MDFGYILTINNVPIREIPLRFKKYNRKWVADGNLNRIKIFKTKINGDNSLNDLKREYKYCSENFEFNANEVKVSTVKLVIEE